MHSALYAGEVRHRRHAERAHAFTYAQAFPYLDLAELDRVFAGRWLWSVGRRNLAAFHRADFHGDPATPLDSAVRATVEAATGTRPGGPIRMLGHLRYYGQSFNPVSFYYGFAEDGTTLEWILAEITNTPWPGTSTSASTSRPSCRCSAAITGVSPRRVKTCACTWRSWARTAATSMPPSPWPAGRWMAPGSRAACCSTR